MVIWTKRSTRESFVTRITSRLDLLRNERSRSINEKAWSFEVVSSMKESVCAKDGVQPDSGSVGKQGGGQR